MSLWFLSLSAAGLILVSGGAPLPKGEWEAHGLPIESKKELQQFLAGSYERRETVGGSILIMHAGEVVFEQAFGYANIRHRRAFEMSTPCWIASISKPIVATLAAKLAADGKLDLEAPIDQYLPELAGIHLRSGRPLTRMPRVRELLKHTAGFTPDGKKGGRPWFWKECVGKTLADMVELYPVFPVPGLYCNPGRGCWYSGMGYDVAGRIIEVATGRPSHVVLDDELCDPLGMRDTSLLPDKALRSRAASRYYHWRSDGSFHYKIPRAAPTAPINGTSSPYVPIGGGILSTPADLATFLLLHRNRGMHKGRQFIPPEALAEMYERTRPWPRYGMGFVLGPPSPEFDGHTAWIMHTGSSGTVCWLDLEHDVIGVILTQTQRSRGQKMPEPEKKVREDAPGFALIVKDRIDAIFGWRRHPPRQ